MFISNIHRGLFCQLFFNNAHWGGNSLEYLFMLVQWCNDSIITAGAWYLFLMSVDEFLMQY